jgi:hypothetical protein
MRQRHPVGDRIRLPWMAARAGQFGIYQMIVHFHDGKK